MSRPRKHPSGAAKRKAARTKSEALAEARGQVTQAWAATRSSSSIAKISKEQFDANGPAIELPVYGVPPVTLVSAVNSALVSLEQGQFFAASYLADGMTRDDRVKAKLEERVDALVGAELELEPAKDTARARNIAEDCEDQFRLPQGTEGNKFDVKLLEAAANTWEGFEKLLAHCDDSIAISFLGQKQSTNGQGGLGTQKDAGEESILRITRSDALIYVDLRNQVLKPWADDNYGDEDMTPYPCPQIEPPEDEGEVAKTDLTIGQTLMAFKTAGAPIDQRKYLEKRGYGELLMSEEEHAAAKQQAVEEAQQAMNPPKNDQEDQKVPPKDSESSDT
jgi:hypothetical protein